jgi:hypothetical protein
MDGFRTFWMNVAHASSDLFSASILWLTLPEGVVALDVAGETEAEVEEARVEEGVKMKKKNGEFLDHAYCLHKPRLPLLGFLSRNLVVL